jgi:predicted alpha/beta-hydrolase family hydrolase
VGYLHQPEAAKDGLVLTHGAGGDCGSTLLVALASALADAGIAVLRCDLPFRQARLHGPPRGDGSADRRGLEAAVSVLRGEVPGRVFLGGQSYGGRQATMLCAEKPLLADGLFLTSYPLHPPGKHAALRTQHFPALKTDALFVHGGSDPFASTEEMEGAIKLIPARTRLLDFEGAGHDLAVRRKIDPAMVGQIVTAFTEFFGNPIASSRTA